MLRHRSGFAATAAAVLIAGCGGAGHAAHGSAGQALFAQACSVCHSLTGHSMARQQGGDLLAAHMSRAAMLQFTVEMPVVHRLSSTQLRLVADYVLAVQRRAR